MKALVLYRSYYGNTQRVAETLADAVRSAGHQAEVRDLRRRFPDLGGVDLVFVGSPTRMARVGRRAKSALNKIRKRAVGGTRVAVFDTYGPVPKTPEELEKGRKWLEPGAAGILYQLAVSLELRVHPATLRCEVGEMKGPLKAGELEKATAFAAAVLASAGR